MSGIHHVQRPLNDGQGSQAKKVKFHQTRGLNVVFIKLSDRVFAFIVAIQRRKISNGGGRDDYPTSMLAGVTGDAFQDPRKIDQLFDFLVLIVALTQFRHLLEGFCQGHTGVAGHQFGNPVNKPIGMTQHSPDITNRCLRRHGTEGNDLRDRITAVQVGHVINDFITAIHTKIDIKVGHRYPFRV